MLLSRWRRPTVTMWTYIQAKPNWVLRRTPGIYATLARRSSNMSLFRFFSQGITNELASSTKKDPCSFPMMRYCFLSIMSGHLQPDLLLNSMTSPCRRSVLLFLITCCSITSYVIQDCFLNSRSSSRITSPKTATKHKDWFKREASLKRCVSWVY